MAKSKNTRLSHILFENVVRSEDMALVRSSDRLKKNQSAPSQSAVSTNQGSATSAIDGSTKRTAATKASKTTRQPGTSRSKSVGAKSIRQRGISQAAGKNRKSRLQSVEEQIDVSANDEQEMTNVVTDETEQRGKKNRSSKRYTESRPHSHAEEVNYDRVNKGNQGLAADPERDDLYGRGRALMSSTRPRSHSQMRRHSRDHLDEELSPRDPGEVRSRLAERTRGLSVESERDDLYGRGRALMSSTRPRSHSRMRRHSRDHWVHSPDGTRPEASCEGEQSVKFGRRDEESLHASNYRPQCDRKIDPSIEMPSFDGSGDVELFLHRFETLVEFFNWTEREQVFRIKQCVKADAQYMLLDICRSDNIEEVIEALRKRFGVNAAHAERYRAELGQLRKGKLTLEQLHVKVRTLVSKSAPGPWTALTEIYARDAFLAALDDWDLRKRIMMTCPPPVTLAATYDLALRSAALETGMSSQQRSGSPSDQKSKRARMLGSTDESVTSKQIQELTASNDQLRRRVEDLQKSLQQLKTDESTSRPRTIQATTTSVRQKPSQDRSRDVCHRCGQTGHWARNCRNQKNRSHSALAQLSQPAGDSQFCKRAFRADLRREIPGTGREAIANLAHACS